LLVGVFSLSLVTKGWFFYHEGRVFLLPKGPGFKRPSRFFNNYFTKTVKCFIDLLLQTALFCFALLCFLFNNFSRKATKGRIFDFDFRFSALAFSLPAGCLPEGGRKKEEAAPLFLLRSPSGSNIRKPSFGQQGVASRQRKKGSLPFRDRYKKKQLIIIIALVS
jgi:hypothetical protein